MKKTNIKRLESMKRDLSIGDVLESPRKADTSKDRVEMFDNAILEEDDSSNKQSSSNQRTISNR